MADRGKIILTSSWVLQYSTGRSMVLYRYASLPFVVCVDQVDVRHIEKLHD
jgi:hypothetical protein